MKALNDIEMINEIPFKKCNLCKLIKPIGDYYKCSAVKSGLRGDCKACCNANRVARRKNNKGYERERKLQANYGMSIQDYEEMLEAQDHRCMICRRHKSNFQKGLVVDHCHKIGHVRALLCGPCNKGLGLFRDDPELLKKCIRYLEIYGEAK